MKTLYSKMVDTISQMDTEIILAYALIGLAAGVIIIFADWVDKIKKQNKNL